MYLFTYRGIKVVENYGFYAPEKDRTVESTSLEKIICWINKKTQYVPPVQQIDIFIVTKYLLQTGELKN